MARKRGTRCAANLLRELGLVVRPDDLAFVRETIVVLDFRRDHVRIFELLLHAEPPLRMDGREIVAARFVEPRKLLAEKSIPPFVRDSLVAPEGDNG